MARSRFHLYTGDHSDDEDVKPLQRANLYKQKSQNPMLNTQHYSDVPSWDSESLEWDSDSLESKFSFLAPPAKPKLDNRPAQKKDEEDSSEDSVAADFDTAESRRKLY